MRAVEIERRKEWWAMNGQPKMLLVDTSCLPPVYSKVIEAKELLQSGEAQNAAQAAKMAGISRSAFYKYKDMVYRYNGQCGGETVTVHMILADRPGVLSSLISALSAAGANILTVNQNIPAGGVAVVSVAMRVDGVSRPLEELIASLRRIDGVKTIENITGV